MAAAQGNQYAANAKQAKIALEKALEKKSKALGRCAMEAIWDKQIDLALNDGARDSAQMIIERLDGKAVQAIQAEVDSNIVVEVKRFTE